MKRYRDILNLNEAAERLWEAKGSQPNKGSTKSKDDEQVMWIDQYLAAVARWREHIQSNKDKIKFLQKKVEEDTDRLETAKRKAAEGNYQWGARELWEDSFGM